MLPGVNARKDDFDFLGCKAAYVCAFTARGLHHVLVNRVTRKAWFQNNQRGLFLLRILAMNKPLIPSSG